MLHSNNNCFERVEDDEVDQLRRRLEETERAMERIVAQMGNVSEKLSPIMMADLDSSMQEKVTFTPTISFRYSLVYR